MLVLALDTTTRQGTVALSRDARILGVDAGDAATAYGARLPGDLAHLLGAHNLRVGDVDLFAVAAGPGSFTGLRIGIATMQGLALGSGKPLAGVSALDAIYDSLHSLSPQPSALSSVSEMSVAVWMDAGRGQVFSAIYKNGVIDEGALVDKPAAILARWAIQRTIPKVYAGDGALAYADPIRAAVAGATLIDPVPPLAPSVARLAEAHVSQHGAAPADAVRPIYIRRPDVELARDRKAQ
ncbi:MAG TPA: tRNA (adenosine(37)-N6)-threonylcarbamoyltransferase complex dimerization subunit type 1 TsaB [Vicinamibacterales bacterium]|nr:tRNA (adenosine(37)-N6)-threonylcarbamoyltransferase complex dimerization subunit type 1 TsaB [Vicinamibacterales bacterium]